MNGTAMNGIGKMEAATRMGFAARGIMYLLIAFLALWWGRAEDGPDALKLLDSGAGRAILAVMALGFFAYGIWRLAEVFIDSEGHGSKAKGLAVRAGGTVSGIIHLGLGVYTARLAAGQPAGASGGGSGGGGGTEEGAATALSLPGGEWLLMLAAAALLGTAVVNLVKAIKGSFLKQLDSRAAAQDWVKWAGRGGYAARGVVFAIMAWFFWKAGAAASAEQAGGLGEALGWLTGWPRMAVAIGLGLFGIFSLVEARYRRINDPKVLARLQNAGRRLTP
ncbi:hypothetical protein GCM10007973_00330 [Polymorphobacter multimanifer]|uniref:DUF1206 domain-containing protein n=1 Tax=Polymorphobacter multimanifer TaxID=1070431 RepID=A0A841LAI4_9SPHN|nr:DUF1206 domain-containing protein [Polymorphobacter multimanifer]MBB6226825.1 hypothetical protein [Polymorphobacter multimanifer]GGI67138.1 hypothetical protein GCM10007973_00330 [Polymorphobacter multimanifer]